MGEGVIELGGKIKSRFMDKVMEILPEGGNLNLCLTCGACSSGCPATGLDGLDPRKFLRMAALGMDDEILKSDWVWMCTMCQRCIYVCPMKIHIPQLVYNIRGKRPRDERPKGILGSCDMALKNETTSAMGTNEEDFEFVVEDVLEEYQEAPEPQLLAALSDFDPISARLFAARGVADPGQLDYALSRLAPVSLLEIRRKASAAPSGLSSPSTSSRSASSISTSWDAARRSTAR